MQNYVQRFLFEDLDVRGAFVHLGTLWRALTAERYYPSAVLRMLGQMTATSVLLADNLKQPGRLTLQLRGTGAVSLMVVDCNSELNVRCMAQHKEVAEFASVRDLFADGQLSLILDGKDRAEPYQSVVPIEGDSVAAIFEHYLAQSEQLDSRFFLAVSDEAIGGLFLQKMPTTDTRDADAWMRLDALAGTVKETELLDLVAPELLRRLFHEETVRLFDAQPVTHHFPQDWDKIGNMLRALGRDEIYRVLEERSEIFVRDDLSNHEYRFDKAAIDKLFANMPVDSKNVH